MSDASCTTTAVDLDAVRAAERTFSDDIRCSRGGGQTCAKCNDGAECSVCYIQRHGRVLLAEVRRLAVDRDEVVADNEAADALLHAALDIPAHGMVAATIRTATMVERVIQERDEARTALATARLDGARVMLDKVREVLADRFQTIAEVNDLDPAAVVGSGS